MAAASFHIELDQQGRPHVRLLGQWSLRSLENDFAALKASLSPYFADPFASWDLHQIEQIDTAAAAVLWAGWGAKLNPRIHLTAEQHAIFDMLADLDTAFRVRRQPDLVGP